jgi:hypothetical protein
MEFDNLQTLTALLIPNNAFIPGLALRSNPGLKFANAFSVEYVRSYLTQG